MTQPQKQPIPRLRNSVWSEDVLNALNDFLRMYGKDSPDYQENSYVVSDFDNTTCIFDIQDQALVYQLEYMCFAVTPEELYAVLRPGIDGELTDWVDDIAAAFSGLTAGYGPFTPRGISEAEREQIVSDPLWGEFASKMLILAGRSSECVDNWKIRWFAGMTEQEIYGICYRSCVKYQAVDTYQQVIAGSRQIASRVGPQSVTVTNGLAVTESTRELWKALSENGIDVWACSASEVNQVRAAIDVFGLYDYCTGVTAKTMKFDENGRMLPEYDFDTGCGWLTTPTGEWKKDTHPIRGSCREEGKVITILNGIAPHYAGKAPLAGFMDSTGDFNFCTEFARMKLVVCFNRADRKITDGGGLIAEVAVYEKQTLGYDLQTANAAGDTLYVLQGRNDNGQRGFRRGRSTVPFGTEDKQLFKNEDNWMQLRYMEEHRLSVAEAMNTFAIRRAADDPDNVLGITYGFLQEYRGYKSRA